MDAEVTRTRIVPAPGVLLRDPAHGYRVIPEDGADVVIDQYWHRAIARGDAIVVAPAAGDKPAKGKSK